MSNPKSLAEKLAGSHPVISSWSSLPSPLLTEMLARVGYDAVTIDMQHGMYDFDKASEAVALTVLGGASPIVRIPVGDNALAGRMVDMGAEAIIAPMINSKHEAEAFIEAIKYPPVGERSWSPIRAMMLSGLSRDDYFAKANSRTLAIAMIETRQAFDALDEILSVPNLDGVFVGPSDLSISLSNGAALDPNGAETARYCGEIAAKANAAGKFAGIFCLLGEKAHAAADQGFRLISHGVDKILFENAAMTARSEVEGIAPIRSSQTEGY